MTNLPRSSKNHRALTVGTGSGNEIFVLGLKKRVFTKYMEHIEGHKTEMARAHYRMLSRD